MKLLSPIKPLTLLFCGIMISACNGGGGTQAATTATIDKNTTTKAAIELSQMGVLPVAADNNTSYPLIINNFSNDNYKIKSAYVINANGNQDQNIAEVKITDNHLDAHGNLKLNILPHSKTATSARLVVELANETDATITKTEELLALIHIYIVKKALSIKIAEKK